MARWQRHARVLLAVFAVGFATLLWWTTADRQAPAVEPAPPRLDPKAVSQILGGDVLQHKGVKRDIKVEFGSQLSYEDGKRKFTAFKAFIDDRGGRSFIVSGNEAWVGADLSAYDVRGNVTLTTSDGLTVTTPEATFVEAEGVLRGSGPVQFRRERTTGSGVGFTYDRSLDRLWLLNQAAIAVAPAPDGGGGMRVTSGAAGYSRAERYMRFERTMRMERQGQQIEAAQSTVFLLRDRDEPETVELRGNARITGAAGTGSLQAMQARDINLRYGPDGRTLQQALLMGQGAIQLARPDGSAGQHLQADTIDTSIAPDGSVTRLVGRDQVRVALPATSDASARTVTAALLDGTGEAGKGLTSMSFDGGVEYREDAAKGSNGRVARARTLKAAISASGTIEEANFAGAFRFEDGKLVATSAAARYQVTRGGLELTGSAQTGRPKVVDERVTIDADKIDVTLSPRHLRASGSVQSELAATRRRSGERGTTLLKDNEAVAIAADGAEFEEGTGQGTYKGQAHLFQASGTSIRADMITMDDKEGRLTATGNVRAALPIAGRPGGNGSTATSIARAEEFTFDDVSRRAVFVKQAQFDGAQGNLHAHRIELVLARADNTLERLEAQDAVEVVLDTRKATGQRMTYHPADEKYVLTGSPVRLVQECQESTGRTLTFYKASDRIQVDGNEEIRVQTKGGKCPEPPR